MAIATVLAAVCFAVDMNLPLGVAGGVPYVTVVLVCLWSPRRRDILLCTVLCSALTLLGYQLSPAGGELWMVLSNRALAIFAIWSVGLLGYYRRQSEDALRVADAKMEKLARFPGENPSPVMQVARDGTILYANSGSHPLMSHWGAHVGQALPTDWQQRIEALFRSGRTSETEIECQGRVFVLFMAPMVEEGYVYLYGYDTTERRRAEEQNKSLLHDMGERIKELTCMYKVATCVSARNTLDAIFQEVADAIPPGWHYPVITRGRLRFDGREYVSEPFEETQWKQTADIVVSGKCRGTIEVYYMEPCPELDEGPFMKEERNLIDGMARALSQAIEAREVEEELAATVQELRRFDRVTVGREERMIELKHEVNEMARKAGIAPPYDSALVEGETKRPGDPVPQSQGGPSDA